MFGFFRRKSLTATEASGKSPSHDPIAEFWGWVVANRAGIVAEVQTFGTEGSLSKLSIHELGARLQQIDPGLVHEVGMADPDTLDVVISAEGSRALFPVVLKVASGVPKVTGLKATPFRQRTQGMSLEVLGQTVTAENLSYVSFREGEKIGLDIFFDIDLDENGRAMVGFLMLDTTLGEYDVGTVLGSIEFREGRAPAEAKRLTELPQEVDALRPTALN